ncbi:MAG: HAMP domain-containing sensor histidine kinase [Verrucomicrobia bacterium]|nr:HAMP domain-containing sensor histidine kinase [Verrucomicrobiota bacterium]
MKSRFHASLLVKVLGWLLLHLLVLLGAFAGFVAWQLGLGLDSLLSGAAGERLRAFGESVQEAMIDQAPDDWNQAMVPLATAKQVAAAIYDPEFPERFPLTIPANVIRRANSTLPPGPDQGQQGPRRPPLGRFEGPPEGRRPPEGRGPPDARGPMPLEKPPGKVLNANELSARMPLPRPVFLLRGNGGNGYWAGVHLSIPGRYGQPMPPRLLLIRAARLDGSGMFFDLKPWLWGGLGVLALSLAFWTPFILGITRYLHRLTLATDGIAAGHFEVSLPPRSNDELGGLGQAIQAMAARLDHLISGQKRFLGDAAHELCAPLARLRTGLGILEMKLGENDQVHLAAIEAEAAELATLINEILAFSRAKNRPAQAQTFLLDQLVREVAAREGAKLKLTVEIPPQLQVTADPTLLARAIANILRNSATHAGPVANVAITATASPSAVTITIADDGPGVAPEELPRLFEPFYRPDRSRSRDTGGSGLGLAIVRSAIEVCGGTTSALLPAGGGFAVAITLPVGTQSAAVAAP